MDGRASVLFVVTIPTATEEDRLKREFLAKKYDFIKSEQADKTPINNIAFPLKADSNRTTTITSTLYTTPTTVDNGDDNADIDAPSSLGDNANEEINSDVCSIEYCTFPKRRKLNQKLDTLEELSDNSTISTQQAYCSQNHIDVIPTNDLPAKRKSLESLKDILCLNKRKIVNKKSQYAVDLDLEEDICMETVVKEILRKFLIQDATWIENAGGVKYQIFFTVEFNETYEKILLNLNEWGIGDREGSTVSVMNCITSKTYAAQKGDGEKENDFCTENKFSQKQSAWERFMNSVRSRLNVSNIVRDVRQDATITFDFVVLLVSAAILASFGLVENSTIFLASSMLISPLMGPIIAAIFGTVIKDHSLRRLGLKNELLGILMAVFVGFLFGMVVSTTDDRYGIGDGLTEEMLARCELHSLIVGVFTAIPSGAAAAIAILGGNIGSLVGVAISASLLPPAVNSGLLWALALIYKMFEKDETRYNNVVKSTLYSKNQATELAILGSISMCLTISNIICIYIMGILVLKVKEIAPLISRNNSEFWKHDIKIARNLNRKDMDTDTAIIDEFVNLPKEDQRALAVSCDFLRNLHMDESFYQNSWSPIDERYSLDNTYERTRENYSTAQHVDRLHSIIGRQHSSVKEKRFLPRRNTGLLTDFFTSYKVLSENIPRCSTMPSKVVHPFRSRGTADTMAMANSNTGISRNTTTANASTRTVDERKTGKFIVTPADEDPLHYAYIHPEVVDV